jgi:hypothetical protein
MRSRIFSGLPSQRRGRARFPFPFRAPRRDVFLADEARIGGGDVHGDVVHQFLEIVGAGHEIGLAVDFHQHAELAAGWM